MQGKGHVFKLEGKPITPLPSLLTTDPDVRWAFSGPVEISVNDEINDEFDAVLRHRIPLCGKNWLGVLQLVDDSFHLDAYSHKGDILEGVEEAYSPDWGESLEEDNALICTIRRDCTF